jgi:predicted dehydrogenase
VELYALCDAAQDLVGKVASVFEPTFSDYDAMLADENVEAVVVAIADQFHVPMASPQAKRPTGDPKADKFAYYLLGHGTG